MIKKSLETKKCLSVVTTNLEKILNKKILNKSFEMKGSLTVLNEIIAESFITVLGPYISIPEFTIKSNKIYGTHFTEIVVDGVPQLDVLLTLNIADNGSTEEVTVSSILFSFK